MSDRERELAPAGAPIDPSGLGPEVKQSVLGRYDVAQKAGGLLAPVLTALLAFIVGGLVVLVTTGSNPITTYRAIFDGAGFNWLFPWVTGTERTDAAANLQQTLIITTTLILTGLAVAFAFRCGLFNIGGQGLLLPVMPAVANAIDDAVGVRIDEIPITPDKVLKALQLKAAGQEARIG